MASYRLTLTHSEMLWLLDRTSIFSPCPPDNCCNVSAMMDFRLKLLGGLLETKDNLGSNLLNLETAELWIALEQAKLAAQIGSEKVGINLIHKLGAGLLAVSADAGVHEAVMQLGEGDDREPDYPDRLAIWQAKEREDDIPN